MIRRIHAILAAMPYGEVNGWGHDVALWARFADEIAPCLPTFSRVGVAPKHSLWATGLREKALPAFGRVLVTDTGVAVRGVTVTPREGTRIAETRALLATALASTNAQAWIDSHVTLCDVVAAPPFALYAALEAWGF